MIQATRKEEEKWTWREQPGGAVSRAGPRTSKRAASVRSVVVEPTDGQTNKTKQ
jgi:hypothetical protein